MSIINHPQVRIRIQTPPEWDPRTGAFRPGELIGFDSDDNPLNNDIEAVMITKRLNEPCGRATIKFAPRFDSNGESWLDRIPGWSLIEIWMGHLPDVPLTLKFVGLTDTRMESGDYSQRAPEHDLQLSAFELSILFVQQKILYLPVPPQELRPDRTEELALSATDRFGRTVSTRAGNLGGTVVTRDISDEQRRDLPPNADPAVSLLGMLAIDPELSFEGASPVDAMKRFVQMMTVGLKTEYNTTGAPLANFEFPDAKLKDLLFFDADRAAKELFDPNAKLPAAAQLSVDKQPLWHIMSTWCDESYQELFARSVDLALDRRPRFLGTMQEAACEIVFRKRPYAGRINEAGELVGVAAPQGTQFDADFVDNPNENLFIDDTWVIGYSLRRATQNISNIYFIHPVNPAINDPAEWRAVHPPLLDDAASSPSRMGRFGPRLMEIADYYLSLPHTQAERLSAKNPSDLAKQRQRLLHAWHRFEPLFREGEITLKGNPLCEVGKRLVHNAQDGRAREYYITGEVHSLVVGGKESAARYTTRVTVERGWDIPG